MRGPGYNLQERVLLRLYEFMQKFHFVLADMDNRRRLREERKGAKMAAMFMAKEQERARQRELKMAQKVALNAAREGMKKMYNGAILDFNVELKKMKAKGGKKDALKMELAPSQVKNLKPKDHVVITNLQGCMDYFNGHTGKILKKA